MILKYKRIYNFQFELYFRDIIKVASYKTFEIKKFNDVDNKNFI